jgi:hypothetical protein
MIRLLSALLLSVALLYSGPVTATTGDLGNNQIGATTPFSVQLNLSTPSNALPATLTVKYGLWSSPDVPVDVFFNSNLVGNFLANLGYVSPGPKFANFDVTGQLLAGANTVSFQGSGTGKYVVGQVDLAYDNSGTPGVPEPSTLALVAGGLFLIARRARR